MFTNTYAPHVGGVAHSVSSVAAELRRQGHDVLVVCPEFPSRGVDGPDIVRVPAVQEFNGSDFSVALPAPIRLRERLAAFQPDIIHSHHPFLLGDTAIRCAAELVRPVVFTHHTLYERYTHYVPADSPQLQRFVVELAVGYGNLCSRVVAPSESIRALLLERGLAVPVEVIPTGVDGQRFAGSAERARRRWGIPGAASIVGHVGRLAPEKNLGFLAEAVAGFMRREAAVHFLVVGGGPSAETIEARCREYGVAERLRLTGPLTGEALADAYAAMDVFGFSSCSETQGLVLMEAMTSGAYTVALDAPGARDVIENGVNGELVFSNTAPEFTAALAVACRRAQAEGPRLRDAVRRSAEPYAIERTTARLAELYTTVIATAAPPREIDESGWATALRRFEAEWELWGNMAQSAVGAVGRRRGWWSKLRERFRGRSGKGAGGSSGRRKRGLVLVQIDGLSRRELERALEHRRMPFVRKMIHRGGCNLVSHYSGMPSTTPAVQGELFYGIPTCVPAFEFYDRSRREMARMFYAESAGRVEARLQSQGRPLLAEGSSYSNIFSGGSRNAWYCAASFGLPSIVRLDDPARIALRAYWYAASFVRIAGLLCIESVLALGDFARGVLQGYSLKFEALFIPTRLSMCILLRELITIGARIDIERGVSIVHLNFLGYDEQAHRRGPASAFAHWALKGIDRAIRRLARSAAKSRDTDYEVWVYADHGQEATVPYEQAAGRSLEAAVREIFGLDVVTAPAFNSEAIELFRSSRGGQRAPLELRGAETSGVVLSAMGPLGHLYLQTPLSVDERVLRCGELVEKGGIPLVMTLVGEEVWVWNRSGRRRLEESGPAVLGADHAFAAEVVHDLLRLCRHPDAGDIVIAGWRPDGAPLSFVHELGAHGGPGALETHAFAVIPAARHPGAERLRPADLRQCVERYFEASPERPKLLDGRAAAVRPLMGAPTGGATISNIACSPRNGVMNGAD